MPPSSRTIRTVFDRAGGGVPASTGPALSGPALTGPALSGQALSDPALDGPVVGGQALDGPVVDGPVLNNTATTTRLMLFFAIVYAIEGLGQAKTGIIGQPLTHFLKETRGWGPLEVAASLAVLDLPWIVKPIYGLISDFFPLAGFRRRPWLALSALTASAAFFWAGSFASIAGLVPALVFTSIGMAAASTVCGALLVENGQRLNASGAFVNQQWLWFNVAAVAAALTGGWLVEILPAETALRAAAWIAAAAPLALLPALRLVSEDRAIIDRASFAASGRALAATFKSRNLWVIAAFLFFYYFSPGFGTPLYFELTDKLKFSQSFIGFLSAVTAFGWIAGGVAYRYVLFRVPARTLIAGSLIFGAAGTLSYLGLIGPVSAVAIYFVSGAAGMIANIATIGLAAAHCPKRAEGFTFAALMSVINLASPLSDTIGAAFYEHVFANQLAPLIVVSAAFTLFVLILVPFVSSKPRKGFS